MLLQQATTVFWEKWAAKHEYEELKEGILLEPALALLLKSIETLPELVLEGGWVQQRLFDNRKTLAEIPKAFGKCEENRDIAEMAQKAMKRLRKEVEKKGLKLSVTEDGKEGKEQN